MVFCISALGALSHLSRQYYNNYIILMFRFLFGDFFDGYLFNVDDICYILSIYVFEG